MDGGEKARVRHVESEVARQEVWAGDGLSIRGFDLRHQQDKHISYNADSDSFLEPFH